MDRPARNTLAVTPDVSRGARRRHRGGHVVPALAVACALAFAQGAAADVTRSGDVTPAFVQGPVVDLTGQKVFVGNTIGTLNVTAGGILTAAQIVAGTGGLGSGFVNVTGAGSTIRLTGGAANNGLDIGSWGSGILTVANGGLITCASVAACPFNSIANAAGSTGTVNINGGSITGLGQVAVGLAVLQQGFGTAGANTSATMSITNGGLLSSSGVNSVANNIAQTGGVTGNVTIDGAGSRWTIGRDLAGGGGQAALTLATAPQTVANVTLSNGGNLTITGARSTPATDNSLPFLQMSGGAGATSTMTVTSGASIRFAGDSGVLNVGGNNTTSSVGSVATLNITGGGTVSGTGANGLVFSNVGRNGASGMINISGAGSQLVLAGVGGTNTQGLDGVGATMVVGRNQGAGGGSGTVNVTAGGALVISDNGFAATAGGPGLDLARGLGSSATVTVSGASSSITVSETGGGSSVPYLHVGNGGNAEMTIKDGALVSVLGSGQRNFTVNNSATGLGVLNMSNGGQIVASRFAIADNGGKGTATMDRSTVNVNGVVFFNEAPIGAAVRVGRGEGAVGLLTMQNGSVINVNNTIVNASVILGGTASLEGGTGTLNMSGGSAINFTGTAASASLQVGGLSGTGFMTMTGASTVNVGATGTALVGNTADSIGTLTVAGGSTITANTIAIGGNSDTVAGGNGTATVTGAGSALIASGDAALFTVGRSGSGSLTVSDGAALSGTSFSLGRAEGGFGTLLVDHGVVNLSGQQTATTNNVGATLSIGVGGGTGLANITNGSVVTISNPGALGASLNVGGRADPPAGGGNGVLNVSGSQINVVAAPGLATVRIGHDGNAIATFTGSTMNIGPRIEGPADGSLIVAGQPGSTGTLSLNAGSVVNAGYVGVAATAGGPGGTGTLVLNNSTVNTGTFQLGASGLLTGNNGIINASGDVIIGGTISPGNSPGRLTINCNLITLPGSMLILEIQANGDGFAIDQLRIGRDSTFDLHTLHVVFDFLGNTDPNSFVASGGFDLDNFIKSALDPLDPTKDLGLSTAFAPGHTWTDIIDPAAITVTSAVYDVSNVQLGADGTINVVAVPVPEPSTWAMLVFGMVAMTTIARRRALARRR